MPKYPATIRSHKISALRSFASIGKLGYANWNTQRKLDVESKYLSKLIPQQLCGELQVQKQDRNYMQQVLRRELIARYFDLLT